ncbi:hypothetical protein COOONC_22139 [Cooperia oncophora]
MFPPLRGPVREELQVLYKLISQNIDNWISNIPSPFHIPHTENKMPEKPWTRPEIMHPIERLKNPFKPARRQDALRAFITPKSRKRNARYKIHLGRPQSGLLPEPEMPTSIPFGYEEGFFIQPVDHFDNQNVNTFDQRKDHTGRHKQIKSRTKVKVQKKFNNKFKLHVSQKFYKNRQWAKEGGPIFLKIGGESPASPAWVLNENLTYLTWAKKFGATVYMLEHRYYGQSKITKEPTSTGWYTDYLSSMQMLFDVANFIRNVNAQMGSDKPPKWITFGGSYFR